MLHAFLAPTLKRLAIGLALAASLASATADDREAQVLAVVNGTPIPQSLLERSVRQQVSLGRSDSPELRRLIRDELIAQELLYQEAVRLKLDRSSGFAAAMERARRSALATLALQSGPVPPISDADVRQAYDRSLAGMLPQDFRLRAIVVREPGLLSTVRSKLARGESFEDLAAEHSLLPSARRGGDLGWLNLRQAGEPGPLPAPVAAEVRELSRGGITQPIRDDRNGWWLVRIEDVRPAQAIPYDQAAARIRQVLEAGARNAAAREMLSRLRSNATVKINGED